VKLPSDTSMGSETTPCIGKYSLIASATSRVLPVAVAYKSPTSHFVTKCRTFRCRTFWYRTLWSTFRSRGKNIHDTGALGKAHLYFVRTRRYASDCYYN
jgi:hypothetical protein